MTAQDVIRILDLEPLPREGGYFRQTLAPPSPAAAGSVPLYTAIYYLITPESYSAFHKLESDELWHFYGGDEVEQLQLLPGGDGRLLRIGSDIKSGARPQAVTPAGVWQSTRLRDGGDWALLGTTMTPGYRDDEYTHADPALLKRSYPRWAGTIERFLPDPV